MISKKSQITYFIGIGIFMIAIAILIIYIMSSQQQKELEVQEKLQEQRTMMFEKIDSSVKSCLSESSKKVLDLALRQGGFIHPEQKYFYITKDQIYKVPIYIECGKPTYPDIQEMKRDIERSIDSEFIRCFEQISRPISYMDLNYSKDKAFSQLILSNKSTTINLNFVVQADIEDTHVRKETFSVTENIKFKEMYDTMLNFINISTRSSSILDMSNRFGFDISPYCQSLTKDYQNLFIKLPSQKYKHLIQIIDYSNQNSFTKDYLMQFATANMNYAKDKHCYNINDSDKDSVPDSFESPACQNTTTTIVDSFGCSCNSITCNPLETCTNYYNKPTCIKNSELNEYQMFYDHITNPDPDFIDDTHIDNITVIYDCKYDKDRCPYERCCTDGDSNTYSENDCYGDAKDPWKDECKMGEIQIESRYNPSNSIIVLSDNTTEIESSSDHPDQDKAIIINDYFYWAQDHPGWPVWQSEFGGAKWIWDSKESPSYTGTISEIVKFKKTFNIENLSKYNNAELLFSCDGYCTINMNQRSIRKKTTIGNQLYAINKDDKAFAKYLSTPNFGLIEKIQTPFEVSSSNDGYPGPYTMTDKEQVFEFLKEGENEIIIEVNNGPDSGPSQNHGLSGPGGTIFHLTISDTLNTLYRCCRSGSRYYPWAYHATLYTWKHHSTQEDCKDLVEGRNPVNYPMTLCWRGEDAPKTAYNHDPKPDLDGRYGLYMSTAQCQKKSKDICASDDLYKRNILYHLGPYDDKDDSNDCIVITKSQKDFINNTAEINFLGTALNTEQFVQEFNTLKTNSKDKIDRILYGQNNISHIIDYLKDPSIRQAINNTYPGLYEQLLNNLTILNTKLEDVRQNLENLDLSPITRSSMQHLSNDKQSELSNNLEASSQLIHDMDNTNALGMISLLDNRLNSLTTSTTPNPTDISLFNQLKQDTLNFIISLRSLDVKLNQLKADIEEKLGDS